MLTNSLDTVVVSYGRNNKEYARVLKM